MRSWDEIFETNPKYKPLNDIFLLRLLSKVKQESNAAFKKIVDLGCGTADTVFQFARLGFSVEGIDVSSVALKKLKEKLVSKETKNINLRHGDLNVFSEKIEADIYFCSFVYAFIENKEHFLKYVSDCMTQRSVFILITPVTYKNISYLETDKPNIAVDFEATKNILSKYFSSVEEYHHDYVGVREDYVTFFIKK
ncbi:MAG: hypothetical protein COT25_04740 [Candidatus Kerfeldbacteria bacterium CG08_land_8_20_14_0_20_42_7]|uniref:Methyltransferase domain-containing protein n=1 Tax=Candidatus Kerfeldbacteria bacterium CG08_land_8_20_14_0_20_42_7 TaxID=2014245 RepID=A0A2H0YRM4_9BACT|nr:MAG: hypothetical protein COT25_04740 [Candidatus Kerfeldbacteria bacterium CG08_land_8_20_14_0_20_42_7]